jgi:DNA-binding FrmR family transcriptional regulator
MMALSPLARARGTPVAHTIRDKQKLLNRVRRIKGQVEAIERAIDGEQDCSAVLHALAACHGALKGLMAEVIEGHIRFHVVDPDRQPASDQGRAAQELIDVIRAYLK